MLRLSAYLIVSALAVASACTLGTAEAQELPASPSPGDMQSLQPAHPHAGHAKHHGGKLFERYDVNHTGMIQRSQLGDDRKALKRFDAADLNHDGVVTLDEARTAKRARRAARSEGGSPNGMPPSGYGDGGMPYGQSTLPAPGYGGYGSGSVPVAPGAGGGSVPVTPGPGAYSPGIAPSTLSNGGVYVQGGRTPV